MYQSGEWSDLTAADVKKAALKFGADIVGIGSIDRWASVPKQENPIEIMPRAKSVIGIGFRMHHGSMSAQEEGTYYSAYTLGEFFDVNRVIAPMVQRQLTSFLEDYGYESVPVMYFSHILGKGAGEPSYRDDGEEKARPEVFFNFRTGGVLCGLGEIGHSRMLLTPRFGPAQRLYFIITEAELEPDEIVTGICDHCMECVKNCPAHALSFHEKDDIDVPGVVTIHRSSIKEINCRIAHVGGGFSPFAPSEVKEYVRGICDPDSSGKSDKKLPTLQDIKTNVTEKVSYAANAERVFKSPAATCGDGCIRACVRHLEATGRISQRFRSH